MKKAFFAVAALCAAMLMPSLPANAADTSGVGQRLTDAAAVAYSVDGCSNHSLVVEAQHWDRLGDIPAQNLVSVVVEQWPATDGCTEAPYAYWSERSDGGIGMGEVPAGAITTSANGDTFRAVADVALVAYYGGGTAAFHLDATWTRANGRADHVATLTGTLTGAGVTIDLGGFPWGQSWDEFAAGRAPLAWMGDYVTDYHAFQQLGDKHSLFEDYRAFFPKP